MMTTGVCPHGRELKTTITTEHVGDVAVSQVEQTYCPECLVIALVATILGMWDRYKENKR